MHVNIAQGYARISAPGLAVLLAAYAIRVIWMDYLEGGHTSMIIETAMGVRRLCPPCAAPPNAAGSLNVLQRFLLWVLSWFS